MDDELQKWIDVEQQYLRNMCDTIMNLESQLIPLSFDIHYEIEGKGFAIIWCRKAKRIIYLPDDGIATHLHQTKVEVREKVIPYFDKFKDYIVNKLKERHESKRINQ